VLLRKPEVRRRTGFSNAALYAAIRKGEFPKQVRVSKRATAWVEQEIDEWISTRMRARDEGGEV
jgi:prophage regulatory protein